MATAPEHEVISGTDERTKPPFLRRVRMRGYKSIAFCDVDLQPLTILVGRNASGKSNFIDGLSFLRDVVTRCPDPSRWPHERVRRSHRRGTN